jgi:(1->4)-alpha-D-glucan 1-alpha-D-glucosylmutase
MPPIPIPTATYRLQFHAGFTFEQATAIVDYLDALGISHCYASSYLAAVPGSTHGYDVADPTRLNPEIGTTDTYTRWIDALRAHGMGHIVDLVPNHMGIAKSANPWWQDVLENGPSSMYANAFDIDWRPLKTELSYKVLLPILGDTYGAVLERQEAQLCYNENGSFCVRYFETVLPVAPGTYDRILSVDADTVVRDLGEESIEASEFLSILTAIRRLPPRNTGDEAQNAERHREKEVIKRRLAALARSSATIRAHIDRAVALFNGTKGDPRSFDRLDGLLSDQPYRIAYWRVAAEEINYRRFFDINELAATRMEDPAVFEPVHEFVFRLIREGLVDGVRIDHVDGLFDPDDYLQRLRARARETRPDVYTDDRPLYVVVEKILGIEEALPAWPVNGTTGYDFLVMVNGLFVDQRNERAIDEIYERFTRLRTPFRETAYRSKQLILRLSMASELNVLAHQLNRFSERSRHYRDFTLNSLAQAIREIIACFPVYRTYVTEREPGVSDRDRRYIDHAVAEAKRRNPGRPRAVFDFVRGLLLKKADYIPESERSVHMTFVGKFQQVTSPVTAKGIEDTALYNYNRLVSLNEVGGEPDHFGIAPAAVHAWMQDRASRWPHALSASSTHDTKRSEDVRARLNVLSEIPGAWKQAATGWARLNRKGRTTIDGQSYPSRNEEYLLYQTLVGSWPLEPMDEAGEREYCERIRTYMQKAMREAKVFTSWLNPSEEHEEAMANFVESILARDNKAFRDDFAEFTRRISTYGLYNSLAQLAVKIGAPGVPDFYQGTELWDFSLVDPDNRRPVDYERRRALLQELRQEAATGDGARRPLASRLASTPRDDRTKLYATSTMLAFRREHEVVLRSGVYVPLTADGSRREHVFGFARTFDSCTVLIVVPRLVAGLLPDADVPPLGERVWGDTRIRIPPTDARCFRQALTGECAPVERDAGGAALRVADVLADFPVAMLDAQ